MRDISMHVLDIVMNSINANAKVIEVILNEQIVSDYLELIITDDGDGMTEDTIQAVCDPFYTTRITRRVGLGLPLLSQNVALTEGEFSIDSEVGEGTTVYAKFTYSHIDRVPIGEISETIMALIMMEPDVDVSYTHIKEEKKYALDTREIKKVLKEVPINDPKVLEWLKEDLLNDV